MAMVIWLGSESSELPGWLCLHDAEKADRVDITPWYRSEQAAFGEANTLLFWLGVSHAG
jgi:hypothetical protein